MSKILELIGLALIGGTVYSFIGIIPNDPSTGWPVFWSCAAGALAIILIRKRQRKQKKIKF